MNGHFENADVNHIDGNKANNHYSNLEWCTRSENLLHAFRVLGRPVPKHRIVNRVRVVQLKEDGTFVREWESIVEAAKNIGVNESNIRRCMYDSEHWEMTGGYKWIRSSEYYMTKDKSVFCGKKNRRHLGKVVHQYSVDGKYINTFSSVSEAAKTMNGSKSRIALVANKGKGMASGYRWVYDKIQYGRFAKKVNCNKV